MHLKLMAVARADPVPEGVPYAFEQRVMARVGLLGSVDPWAAWGTVLWRAVAPCLGLAFVLCAVTWSSGAFGEAAPPLDDALESTLLAVTDAGSEAW